MGLTYADIEVENLFTRRALKTKSLVDSGAVFLTIPEHIAVQLGFDVTEVGTREVVLRTAAGKWCPWLARSACDSPTVTATCRRW